MTSLTAKANKLFVYFVLLSAVLGFFVPPLFSWVGHPLFKLSAGGTSVSISFIHVGLGLIMLGMGLTLSVPQVLKSLSHPHWVGLGILAQYLIMPALAFALSFLFGLDRLLAAGVILVGCCPGGTASNVIAFLSRSDVPLSVAITLASTLLSPLVTPWLTWFYAQYLMGVYSERVIQVPILDLTLAAFIIVGPIVAGLLVRQLIHRRTPEDRIRNLFTLFSIAIISLLVAYIVGQGRTDILVHPGTTFLLLFPVILHNTIGLVLGYGTGTWFDLPVNARQSLSIEVGMQNSGLGLALAGILVAHLKNGNLQVDSMYLSLLPLPAVMFSIWHNLTGAMLASRWGGQENGGDKKNRQRK